MRKDNRNRRLLVWLFHQQNGLCALCGGDLTKEFEIWLEWKRGKDGHKKGEHLVRRKEANLNLDHIEPVALGGRGCSTNFQLTHTKCNSRRGTTPVEIYKTVYA